MRLWCDLKAFCFDKFTSGLDSYDIWYTTPLSTASSTLFPLAKDRFNIDKGNILQSLSFVTSPVQLPGSSMAGHKFGMRVPAVVLQATRTTLTCPVLEKIPLCASKGQNRMKWNYTMGLNGGPNTHSQIEGDLGCPFLLAHSQLPNFFRC